MLLAQNRQEYYLIGNEQQVVIQNLIGLIQMIIKSNEMLKVQYISAFILILLVCEGSAYSAPPLCSPKLYQSLKGKPGRATGTPMQVDLFNTMKYASYDQATMVLERMALYSTARNPLLRLLNQSFAIEKVYQNIDDQLKYNFDYAQYCTEDLCEPTGSFSLGSTIPTPKPSLTTSGDTPICYAPDNLLCSDFQPREDKLHEILDSLGDQYITLDVGNTLAYYRKDNQGKLSYCASYDLDKQKIIHVCEKYQQWRSLKHLSEEDLFTDNQLNQLITGDPDKQYMMNYILSKFKFGQRLGRIFNDCLRYGPLVI